VSEIIVPNICACGHPDEPGRHAAMGCAWDALNKGGGRESGGEATYKAGVGSLPTVAANPAAPDGYQHSNEGTAANPTACDFGPTDDEGKLYEDVVCHCGYRERIRALEAELATANGVLNIQGGQIRGLKAHAEKAEAELADCRLTLEEGSDYLRIREQELAMAEARVKALEEHRCP